jgi:hypothetical protein
MKDKLLYLTIGLLVGVVVMQWTMPSGQASGVFPVNGIVASGWYADPFLLDQNGHAWTVDVTTHTWREIVEPTYVPVGLPVPGSQVKFWEACFVVTTDNVLCVDEYDFATQDHHWANYGPWPGGPVQKAPQTWGGVKGKYADKK